MTSANNFGNDSCDKEGKTKRKFPTGHIHVSKNSTDQDPSESMLPGHHLANNNLVNNTRDAPFADVHCATRGTGRLPIDSLLAIDSL